MTVERLAALYYRYICTADVDSFANLFSASAVFNDPVGTPPYIGPQGARKFLTGVLDLCQSFHIAGSHSLVRGDSIAVTFEAAAVGKNGAHVEFGGIDVFTFDQDLQIASLHAFWDAAPLMKALTAHD
jgi:ketosteroid isomerase-like protein